MIYALGNSVTSERYQKGPFFFEKRSAILTSFHSIGYRVLQFPIPSHAVIACVVGRAIIGRRTRFSLLFPKRFYQSPLNEVGYNAPEWGDLGVCGCDSLPQSQWL